MNRRNFMKAVGIGIAGLGLVSPTKAVTIPSTPNCFSNCHPDSEMEIIEDSFDENYNLVNCYYQQD